MDPRPTNSTPLSELIDRHLTRRALLHGAAAFVGVRLAARADALHGGAPFAGPGTAPDDAPLSSLRFTEIPHAMGKDHAVAPGYDVQVVVRWGDPLSASAPEFAPGKQDAAAQERQFGFNNDFLAYLPLPKGSTSSDHGLLFANHEYTWLHMLVPGLTHTTQRDQSTRAQHELEMAAHGHSVVEVKRTDGRWSVVRDSKLNRRITGRTPIRIAGPVAGHERMKTKDDPTGTVVLGTLNNCSGGTTPWGTVLSGEENFNKYFHGRTDDAREARNHARYDVGGELEFGWHRFESRFEIAEEPREANRFGWVVEVDPYDPTSQPVKRTALGRAKHESATCVLNQDRRVVVYSGDDDEFEFVYKFVSAKAWDPKDPASARTLLDAGTLFVARFADDETLEWLPLVHGSGPLTKENGFESQADVLIEARTAATLVGATPMDRPEDVETNPANGKVYVLLTNNTQRKKEETNAANPRKKNRHGHVLELAPPKDANGVRDHAATKYKWEVFLLAGDPKDEKADAKYTKGTSEHGWLSCPDNCAFDREGRIWIATDGLMHSKLCDGVFACDTKGPAAAQTKHFFRAPVGAEICGPCFTPDDATLFLSIQHPGEVDEEDRANGVTFSTPSTRWPDFRDDVPPRPSVIAITKKGGGVIGS
ncbi:MAG: PhoX family phosphatase [Planctomycetes bacterium]|nr:PhoX family phosphatase [Planctomycetota bacterium]